MIEFIAGYVAGVLTLVLAMLVGEQLRRRAAIEMGEPNPWDGYREGESVEMALDEHGKVIAYKVTAAPGSIIPTDRTSAHYGVDGAIHRGPSYSCGLCETIALARKT